MTDLCKLADVKAWLQTGTDSFPPRDDAMLARLIASASRFVESWMARPIRLADWQEVRDGYGGERADRMVLAVTPVVAIISLSIDGLSVAAAQPPVRPNAPGYTVTPSGVILYGRRFARGTANVVVRYTAGYDPVPDDVQQATIELVVRKYRERTRIAEVSRSLGGAETVTYSTVAFKRIDMATDIQVLLQQYRQAAPLARATLLPPAPAPLELEDSETVIELEDGATPITAEAD